MRGVYLVHRRARAQEAHRGGVLDGVGGLEERTGGLVHVCEDVGLAHARDGVCVRVGASPAGASPSLGLCGSSAQRWEPPGVGPPRGHATAALVPSLRARLPTLVRHGALEHAHGTAGAGEARLGSCVGPSLARRLARLVSAFRLRRRRSRGTQRRQTGLCKQEADWDERRVSRSRGVAGMRGRLCAPGRNCARRRSCGEAPRPAGRSWRRERCAACSGRGLPARRLRFGRCRIPWPAQERRARPCCSISRIAFLRAAARARTQMPDDRSGYDV